MNRLLFISITLLGCGPLVSDKPGTSTGSGGADAGTMSSSHSSASSTQSSVQSSSSSSAMSSSASGSTTFSNEEVGECQEVCADLCEQGVIHGCNTTGCYEDCEGHLLDPTYTCHYELKDFYKCLGIYSVACAYPPECIALNNVLAACQKK